MNRVVHCRRAAFDVYIGREFGGFEESIWHNPFREGRNGTRDEVIEKYRRYVLRSPRLMKRLPELRGKTLG